MVEDERDNDDDDDDDEWCPVSGHGVNVTHEVMVTTCTPR